MKQNTNSLNIYFYCGTERPFQADTHALAESLKHLGACIYANHNWWFYDQDAKTPLFAYDPAFDPKNADIVICSKASYRDITEEFKHVIHPFPEWLTRKPRNFFLAYLEDEDAYKPLSWHYPFSEFNLILRTKTNVKTFQPKNFRPWQLGISDYVVQRALQKTSLATKKIQILENYNATHPFMHPLRAFALSKVTPLFEKKIHIEKNIVKWNEIPKNSYDKFHQQQVGRYFNSKYHDLLAESAGCFAFCGEIIPGLPFDPSTYLVGGNKAKIRRKVWTVISKILKKEVRSIQWDSYRFWESLAFACCPIHVDLEKYGVTLPIMPKNWEHYIGLNVKDLKNGVKKILNKPQILNEIGVNGQKWLIEAYGVKNLGRLFFRYVKDIGASPQLLEKIQKIVQ